MGCGGEPGQQRHPEAVRHHPQDEVVVVHRVRDPGCEARQPAGGAYQGGAAVLAGADDPGGVGEVAQVDGGRRPVSNREGEQDRVGGERVDGELIDVQGRFGDEVVGVADGDVAAAGPEGGQGLGRFEFAQRDPELGEALAGGDQGGHHVHGGEGREAGQADRAARGVGGGPQVAFGGLQRAQHDAGVRDQAHALGRQPDPAAVPLQQRHPGLALQHGELLGHRGGGAAEGGGGGRHRPPIGEFPQQEEPRRIQHQAVLTGL